MREIEDYDTVSGITESEMTLKGSRFIGIVMPCPDVDTIRRNLDAVASRYPNATHYCYAAIFDGPERNRRASDNGEPSGTAGRPIQAVLDSTGLSDVMCVVVRYFGGTLLGTGGLVHAYTESSRSATAGLVRVSRKACAVYMFTLDYQYHAAFESRCRDLMAKRPECVYSDRVDVKAWVPIGDKESFERRIMDATERHVRLLELPPQYI
ncbi:MAG: IMPACT family protein [Candidatus Methanomethylophilaceae archaeon]